MSTELLTICRPAGAPTRRLADSPTRRRDTQPRFLFAGGGTGGHLFPGLAVAEALRSVLPDAHVLFAGTGREWEREQVLKAGYSYLAVPSQPLPRSLPRLPRFFRDNVAGYRLVRAWLKAHALSAVVGLGGYASFPALKAAMRSGIPVLLLEQNVVPGRATRWLARGAAALCTAFEETAAYLGSKAQIHCVGNPVRQEIAVLGARDREIRNPKSEIRNAISELPGSQDGCRRAAILSSLGLCPQRHTLLILGGSQGARSLNEAVLLSLEQLQGRADRWQIIHQTGEVHYEQVRRRYGALRFHAHVAAFFSNMADLYRASDLVVCRAGGTTLAELACARLPAVLLPYPYAADDHQWKNAQWYARRGAALVVQDLRDPLRTAQELTPAVALFMDDEAQLRRAATTMGALANAHGASKVADLVMHLAGLLVTPSTQRRPRRPQPSIASLGLSQSSHSRL